MKLYSAKFFLEEYRDQNSKQERIINGELYTVYRPNHGLAHSLRQGFMAKYLIKIILQHPYSSLYSYVHKALQDKKFIDKLFIISTFQRSGRQSEITQTSNPKLYQEYENKDVHNFTSTVDLDYFSSFEEIKSWSSALRWDNTSNLGKILKVVHLLDLRRIIGFDKERIRKQIRELLDLDCCFNQLWNKSGEYLNITGDKDMETNKNWYSNRFFLLNKNPTKMYNYLNINSDK